MKTPVKVIVGLVGVLIVFVSILAILASSKPDESEFSRSIRINAPPEKVFQLVNDFRQWTQWSPWEKLDPDLQRNYSGEPYGKGARYAWKGNGEAGSGEMTIAESLPPSRLSIELHFIEPFEARNVSEFTFTSVEPAQTDVTWKMRGSSPFIMKMMSVLVDFDQIIGKDFEAGLAAMKAAAER